MLHRHRSSSRIPSSKHHILTKIKILLTSTISLCLLSTLPPVSILYDLCAFCTTNPAIMMKMLAYIQIYNAASQAYNPRQYSSSSTFIKLRCLDAQFSMISHSKETQVIAKKELKSNLDVYCRLWENSTGGYIPGIEANILNFLSSLALVFHSPSLHFLDAFFFSSAGRNSLFLLQFL